MATTVGTGDDLATLVKNFILLERDAIAAYDSCIDRLEALHRKDKVSEFRADHIRHLDDLISLAGRVGAEAPAEGDMKQMLTTGKIAMADLVGGDGAILKAMSTNETDTVSAYERGAGNAAIPAEHRGLFERAHADEVRHKSWMDSEAQAA